MLQSLNAHRSHPPVLGEPEKNHGLHRRRRRHGQATGQRLGLLEASDKTRTFSCFCWCFFEGIGEHLGMDLIWSLWFFGCGFHGFDMDSMVLRCGDKF